MATWTVPEPYAGLELTDLPLQFEPACGPRVSFRVRYRQLGASAEDPTIFSVGPGWTSSFRACVYAPNWSSGYASLHREGAGWISYQVNVPQMRDGSMITNVTGGYQIQYKDGSLDTFTTSFNDSNSNTVYFLTTKADATGNSLTYNYFITNGILQLSSITDCDGHSTLISYGNSSYPNLITQVSDPFSRSATLAYDGNGYLTNITDVIGMQSSFTYDSGDYRGFITNLTTPYGSTGFQYGGDNYTNTTTGVDAYTLVTLPTGGNHLYMFRSQSDFLNSWNPTVPNTSPFSNTFEQYSDSFFPLNNSWHWNPQQFTALSTTNPLSLATSDYSLGRRVHWLYNGNASAAASLEQAASPDGTTAGEVTWYDYEGKAYTFEEGSSDFPSFIARLLPDGSTAFSYSQHGHFLKMTNNISTYTAPGGSTAFRTNEFVYGANGIDLLEWIGPNGEQVASNYFSSGNTIHQPDASFDALNEGTYFTYNSCGHVTSIQNPAGLTTTNIYYTSGASSNRLNMSIDEQIGRTNSYTYYANGLIDTHTDERGLVTTQYWDSLQRMVGVAFPDGTTTSNVYTYLDVTGVQDRLGHWDNFGYNAIRQRIAVTNANGVVTLYSYCQCGLLYAVTNAFNTSAQMVTSYAYDNQGNRTNTYLPDATITNWFDALGRVMTTCDAWGCRWFGYNNQGLLTGITNNAGVEKETVFDIEDRPIYMTDANAVTITNTFDVLGRLSTRTNPDGGGETFTYTARGLVAYFNQLGFTNQYGYDQAGRKIIETNADGQILLYTNDAAGDLLSLTDGKSQTTQWNYDQYGRATNKLDQTGSVILKYQYDADNRLTNRWSAAMGTTKYKFDNVGNLTLIDYSRGAMQTPSVTNYYDALDRLTNMVDGLGVTTYTYTSGGFLYTEDGPFASDTVTNIYSNRLRVGLGLQQPTGAWTNGFAYDSAKRLTNVTSQAGSFGYVYDAVRLQLPAELNLPNTSYITNVYDMNARLLSTTLNNSSGTALDAASYGYNAANQRTNFVNAAGTNVDYAYDNIGQLTVATSSVSAENRGYAYDAAWNLNHRTNNGVNTTFSVNDLNELTSEGSSSFHYDANGNLTNRPSITNFYDVENRLIAVMTVSNFGLTHIPIETSFVYDGLSRLRQQIWWTNSTGSGGGGGGTPPPPTGGTNTWSIVGGIEYIYDGNRVIQERDLNNNPLVSYTRGPDLSGTMEGAGGIGGLLARSDGYSSGSFTDHNFYHADGNGNVTYLVTSSQTLAASYRYDPFGNLISSSGSLAASNTYRFSSKEFIPSVSLYYYLYRFYDPGLQRWVNRDPLEERGGVNLYEFAFNDPSDDVDTDGHQPVVNAPPVLTLNGQPLLPAPPVRRLLPRPVNPTRIPQPVPKPVTPQPKPIRPPVLKPPPAPILVVCIVMLPTSTGPEPTMTPTGWYYPSDKVETCTKIKDWPDPETGRRFCTYRCDYSEEYFTREGDDCNKSKIYRVAPPDDPQKPNGRK